MMNGFNGKPRGMAYSGLTRFMRRIFEAHRDADRRGVGIDASLSENGKNAELYRQFLRGNLSRRDAVRFLGLTGAALAAQPLASAMPTLARAAPGSARVVIIGGGLSGVRCAHLLAHHGIVADVYEASHRTGGRTFSELLGGEVIDHGASLVSTEHTALRNLLNTLGLKLEVVNGGGLLEGEEIYQIDGEFYTVDEANADWRIAWKAFKDELHFAPWPQTYDVYTQRGQELDSISVRDWFDPAHPLSNPILAGFGPESRFAKICYSTCVAEYGLEAEQQPALNLLYLLAWNPITSVVPLTGTDEYYHIVGGSEEPVRRMVPELPGDVHLNTALTAIEGPASGPYTCIFSDGTSTVADKLVLTLPFTTLRDVAISADIWNGFRPVKRQAINQLVMGTNAKIHFELEHRTWGPDYPRFINGEERILNGITYSDPASFQLFWDNSVPKEEGTVILLQYLGGDKGASLRGKEIFGAADRNDVRLAMEQVDVVFPGTSTVFTGNAVQSFWAASPWQKGAYICWSIGQYTTIIGSEALPENDNIHFAGEHTSVEFQGYMEGAVRSGERAAMEVLHSI